MTASGVFVDHFPRDLAKKHGDDVSNYVQNNLTTEDSPASILWDTISIRDVKSLQDFKSNCEETLDVVVNSERLNNIRYLNKYLESANKALCLGGLFFGHIETLHNRKHRILKKYPRFLHKLVYSLDFTITRLCPKLGLTKRLYFSITGGKNRVISEMEIYGRLYACGLQLIDSKQIDGKLWFVGRKKSTPAYNNQATYGLFIKLSRHGKNNELISVYKMRTMYPFSEYLQEYISNKNGLQKGGKFSEDPRITTAGRFFRKYWLDEVPMIINVLKGEMKIFGVRPLSSHYLSLYPKALKELRAKVKPGLIPPFYADLPETLQHIIDSEEAYIKSYLRKPILTDLIYFSKAAYNIVIKKARSN
jgi:hypothetical protein